MPNYFLSKQRVTNKVAQSAAFWYHGCMAPEATHIRFAIDLKDRFRVTDIPKYVTGAVYPDSRYKTGIRRELTHPENFKEWNLSQCTDFEKGWYTHLACDKIQGKLIREHFPAAYTEKAVELGDDTWIFLTAIKVLQDLSDLKEFDVTSYLPDLDFTETRNDEDEQKLKEFYLLVHRTYSKPQTIGIEMYEGKLIELGLPRALADNIISKVKELQQDKAVIDIIEKLYDEMMTEIITL